MQLAASRRKSAAAAAWRGIDKAAWRRNRIHGSAYDGKSNDMWHLGNRRLRCGAGNKNSSERRLRQRSGSKRRIGGAIKRETAALRWRHRGGAGVKHGGGISVTWRQRGGRRVQHQTLRRMASGKHAENV
jgi:hypothetical protein